MEEVRCPKCGTTRRVAPPVSFQCKGCKARMSVASDGTIRNFVPAKKK